MCIRRIILNIFDYHLNNIYIYIYFDNDIKLKLYEVLFYFYKLRIPKEIIHFFLFKLTKSIPIFSEKLLENEKKNDCTFIN